MGDIGHHFPDSDPKYKEIASSELVKSVVSMAEEKGFVINNVDTMVIAEEPKIHPFRDKMIETLSALLKVDKERVNIKATTNEGLGLLAEVMP